MESEEPRGQPCQQDATDSPLVALTAEFSGSVSISEAPLETDLDEVMNAASPIQSPVKPAFVPRLQLDDNDDDNDETDQEVTGINSKPARGFEDAPLPPSLPPPLPSPISCGGSAREYLQSLGQLPPFPIFLRRMLRRHGPPHQRRGGGGRWPWSPAARSLPSSPRVAQPPLFHPTPPRILPGGPAKKPPSAQPPPLPESGHLRDLVNRVDAIQTSLEALEQRRRLAWETKRLLTESQDLRHRVLELLGNRTVTVESRRQQHQPQQFQIIRRFRANWSLRSSSLSATPLSSSSAASTPRSQGCCCHCQRKCDACVASIVPPPPSSSLSSSSSASSHSSAVEHLNRLLKIRRDIVRQSSPFLLAGGVGVACR